MSAGAPFRYKTAEELRAACDAYFKWCASNPIRGTRVIRKEGSDGEPETRDEQYPRPLTIEGMCDELGISNWTMFKKNNADREGFQEVIDWAANKIRRNQIEGSLVGLYRENLTARLNGIADNFNNTDKPPIKVLEDEQDE